MNTNKQEKEKTKFTDNELLNIFTKNGTLKYVSIRYINKIKEQNPDAYNALVNRFDDSDSFKETIHRLKFCLYDKPCCPICGKKLLYVSSRPPYWQKFCSQECLHKSEEHWAQCKESAINRLGDDYRNIKKTKQTCMKKYGVEYPNSLPEVQEKRRKTNFKKYGDEYAQRTSKVKEKYKETCLKKYGVECVFQSEEIKEKIKQTNLKRYGFEYASQAEEIKEKIKQTNLERYGVTCTLCNDEIHQKTINNNLEKYGVAYYTNKEKMYQTNLEKYGYVYASQSQEIKDKIKNTMLTYYGVSYALMLPYARENNTCNSPESRKKAKETILKNWGADNYCNRRKSEQTNLERYGYTSYSMTNEYKERMSYVMSSLEMKQRVYETKKKNHTFNSSSWEDKTYNKLCDKFGENNIIRNYISDLYPFNCDFYIQSLDLYIECNYHWTHGGHPYNSENLNDIKKVNKYKNKGNYYNAMIYTWTDLDVRKQQIAKENNLNYIMFYSLTDFEKWYNNFIY